MLTAVRNDGLALEYIIEHLEDLVDDDDSQDTREMYLEIVITALKNNGKALQFIEIQSESYQRRYLNLRILVHTSLFFTIPMVIMFTSFFTFLDVLFRISIWLHVSNLHHLFVTTGPQPYSVDMPTKPDSESVLRNVDFRSPDKYLNLTLSTSQHSSPSSGNREPRRSFSESSLQKFLGDTE